MKKTYIDIAYDLALKAFEKDEVPVGCVIVKNNKIISKAYNKKEGWNDPTGHAEIIAIRRAANKLKSWRLEGCDLYVTLQPCDMCFFAIKESRITNVYFGAKDNKSSSLFINDTSQKKVLKINYLSHKMSSKIVKDFFKTKRLK